MVRKSVVLLLTLCFFLKAYSQCEESYQVQWALSNNASIRVRHAAFNLQKDLLVCGSSGTRALVVAYNQTTSIRWAKTFFFGNTSTFHRVMGMSDGGVMLAGYVTEGSSSAIVIVRLNSNGNLIWTRRLFDNTAVDGLTNLYLLLESIAETPDGGIAVCGRKYYRRPDNATNYRGFIFKLNNDGTVAWTREDTNGNDDEAFSLLIDNGFIVVVGRTYIISKGTNFGFLEKIDPVTGQVNSLTYYQLGDLTSNWFRSIEKTATGYVLGTQATAPSGRFYEVVHTDGDGKITDVKQLPSFGPQLIDQYCYPVPLADNSTVVWNDWWYSATGIQLHKINATGTADWKFEYTSAQSGNIYRVLPLDNSVLAVGYTTGGNGPDHILLLKPQANGAMAGCAPVKMDFTVKDSLQYSLTTGTWKTTSLSFQAPFNLTPVVQDVSLVKNILCQSGTSCQINSMTIKGDSIVCTPDISLKYTARLSGTCSIPVQWSLSGSVGTLQTLNDSTVIVHFTNPGTAILQARISGCVTMQVTRSIEYRPMPDRLDLGANKDLCTGDSLRLNAGSAFSYILWSTGASTPEISVNAGGIYAVEVSNDKVCYQRDTVSVTAWPKPMVKLPKDPAFCLPGVLLLDAGGGMLSYEWQDGSTGQTFATSSLGTYYVKVTDTHGCSNADTTFITRQLAAPAHFVSFTDTAVCVGGPVRLTLNSAFASYNWNNGAANTPSWLVTQPGIYTVSVITQDGCTGQDSVRVIDKGCVQQLYVPIAFTPNGDSKNDLFRPIAVGILDELDFRVYDRWGQLIYRTNDINGGWNGQYIDQKKTFHTNVFVWYVQYRFAGSKVMQQQKGTVVLIR